MPLRSIEVAALALRAAAFLAPTSAAIHRCTVDGKIPRRVGTGELRLCSQDAPALDGRCV